MLDRIFHSRTKTVTFAAILLGGSALLSRVFGLIRNGLIAGHFGRGIEADIYFAAFRIPDFVYNIIIAGGVVVAFLPLFSEYYAKDREKAWQMANYVLNIFLLLLVLLCVILFIFTPQLIKLVVPGFSLESQAAAVKLTRLMFLSPILFGLSSIFSGILHYFHRFLAYSLAPILYNLGIIFGIVFLVPIYGILGAAMGVVVGAFLHLAVQIPAAIRCGFRYKPLFSFKFPAIKRIFQLMLPRTFAVASQQINLIVMTAIASIIGTGSIAVFTYAKDLYYLPIGIVAIPYALACFPTLSKSWAEKQKQKFFQTFAACLREILFVVIPFALLLFILRAQIVRLILGSLGPGQFDWLATRLTAACLGIFSLGIFAQALLPVLARGFFAIQDTKTPTLITVAGVALNIALSFYFVSILAPESSNILSQFLIKTLKLQNIADISVLGLALAFAIAVIFQMLLMLIFFYKKMKTKGCCLWLSIFTSLRKIILASLLAGIFCYFSLHLLNLFVATNTVAGLFLQFAGAGLVGALIYILMAFFLKSPELLAVKASILKQFKKS